MEVRCGKIVLELTRQEAKLLSFYLCRSYLKTGEMEVSNLVAEEALAGNTLARNAVATRNEVMRLLGNI